MPAFLFLPFKSWSSLKFKPEVARKAGQSHVKIEEEKKINALLSVVDSKYQSINDFQNVLFIFMVARDLLLAFTHSRLVL